MITFWKLQILTKELFLPFFPICLQYRPEYGIFLVFQSNHEISVEVSLFSHLSKKSIWKNYYFSWKYCFYCYIVFISKKYTFRKTFIGQPINQSINKSINLLSFVPFFPLDSALNRQYFFMLRKYGFSCEIPKEIRKRKKASNRIGARKRKV